MPPKPEAQAEPDPQIQTTRSLTRWIPIEPLILLTLAAIASPISQSTLSPVFGALPSAINHQPAMILTTTLAFILRHFSPNISTRVILQWTAVWAFWIPVVQLYLSRFSGALGPEAGPALQGFLSCHALLIPSVYVAADGLARNNLLRFSRTPRFPFLSTTICCALGLAYLLSMEQTFTTSLPPWRSTGNELTPIQMQLALSAAYTALTQARFARIASLGSAWCTGLQLLALLHTALLNPHTPTSLALQGANSALQPHGWRILDRGWSTTGYISVLENIDAEYRVLRAEHSLLGGEWLVTPARKREEGWVVNEPVYAVFCLLEAVRLIEPLPDAAAAVADREARALVVGLGVGTAAKAFMAHGVRTTVLELDPLVHRYAERYFDFPATAGAEAGNNNNNGSSVIIADAVEWVREAAITTPTPESNDNDNDNDNGNDNGYYTYIIHDVFTGGAEPLALFTEGFLRGLRALLAPNGGAIAINYAGDLTAPLTERVLNTVDKVFEGNCRIYREEPPPPPPPPHAESDLPSPSSPPSPSSRGGPAINFTNIVLFCLRNPNTPITFRTPQPADFLGSKSRETHLFPDPELEIPFPLAGKKERFANGGAAFEGRVLVDEKGWTTQQARSALDHWWIMRDVVPGVVWELW